MGGWLSPRHSCVLRRNRGNESISIVRLPSHPQMKKKKQTIIHIFICLCATGYWTTQPISSANLNRKLFAANILLCELPTRSSPLLLLFLVCIGLLMSVFLFTHPHSPTAHNYGVQIFRSCHLVEFQVSLWLQFWNGTFAPIRFPNMYKF